MTPWQIADVIQCERVNSWRNTVHEDKCKFQRPITCSTLGAKPSVFGRHMADTPKPHTDDTNLNRRSGGSASAPLASANGSLPVPHSDPATPPSPAGGWSETVEICSKATVVPPLGGAMLQPTGILRSDGSYVHRGALWRRHRPITTQPAPPTSPVSRLSGRWLYAGPLWAHFGHFLTESVSRLWAVETAGPIDGVIFTPKRAATGSAVEAYHHAFFESLGLVDVQICVLTEPTQIQELVVPGQGFGLGPMSSGTSIFRRFIRNQFANAVRARGPEKLYISRSQIGPRRGGFLDEARLEAYLSTAGYEVFHPQKHDLHSQIARYKAAKSIVAAEGSALHLVAMLARPTQKVAIVMRRDGTTHDPISRHLYAFSGSMPVRINAIRRRWMPAKGGRAHQGVAELDLALAERQLAAEGFVEGGAGWQSLSLSAAQDIVQAQRYWRIHGYCPEV